MIRMWLDYMKTPMAAPETAMLKAMRMTILGLCFMLPVLVVSIGPLRPLIGNGVGAIIAVVVLALFGLVPVYVIAKTRTDGAYLDAVVAEREP